MGHFCSLPEQENVPFSRSTSPLPRAVCDKHVFFAVRAGFGEARALRGCQLHEGDNLFCFLISDPIIVGLTHVAKKCITSGSALFAGLGSEEVQYLIPSRA